MARRPLGDYHLNRQPASNLRVLGPTWVGRTRTVFYHLSLRCFVVIDLKMESFKAEFAGKMNFYLSAVDDLLRHKDDQQSIGLILCKEKNRLIAEYALRDTRKPIGVASYRITQRLPERLKGSLPTVEEIEAELMEGAEAPGKKKAESSARRSRLTEPAARHCVARTGP